ncbi:hypothetical protein ATZ33_13085 [Enterococcus silesiacus]|uniref:Methicillin resistance factor FemB n=1 Tax=Enterococcus silesiacus TaxID=332949 RepID=A0A0S3KDB3_9ENTE|nr:peptidoglycan bridge formation glycyltransferase FemA/FemB family protein [Enterococcus silesiacus]ALS02283.1 hypothetical protein ATZ33_13085 [Enterococcus silesiacus]OJG92352.1 methicillin resistance factor FemB [Enterococcus silesiacus]
MHFSDEISRKEFVEYTEKTKKGNYLQTIEMADLKKTRGQSVFFVGLKDQCGKVVYAAVATRLKLRVGFEYNISGFEMPSEENNFKVFISGMKKFVKKNNGIYMIIQPNIRHGMFDNVGNQIGEIDNKAVQFFSEEGFDYEPAKRGFNDNGNPFWIYAKDIKGFSYKELAKTYNKEAVYSLKKTNQFGIKVRNLDYSELSMFKKITEETSERRNFHDKSLLYYEQVYKIYGDQAKFLIAELNIQNYLDGLLQKKDKLSKKIKDLNSYLDEHDNKLKKGYKKKANQKKELLSQKVTYEKRIAEALLIQQKNVNNTIILACALFLICPHEVVYLFSGTVEQYKNMYAPFLIQDEMLKYTAENNIPLYNFYGIEGNFDGSDGVLKFKEAFNGYAVELIGEFKFYTSSLKTKMYLAMKKFVRLIRKDSLK